MLIINNIKLSVNASVEEAFSVAKRKLRSIGAYSSGMEFSVYRRSVDARRRSDVKFVYSIAVRGAVGALSERELADIGAVYEKKELPDVKIGEEPLARRPVIVGSGPCGLFCGLLLAEAGYAPIILERGAGVDERVRSVECFVKERVLSPDSNIQFGAGGAGTFSDGKLVTRINDGLGSYVLERFVEFGAPEDIKYVAKPHIGTDVLRVVVQNMLDRIVTLGATVHYNTRFEGADFGRGRISRVYTSRGEMEAGALVLAIGHSARDTYECLFEENIAVEAKQFSVGMRIEHLARDIDKAMYGDFAGHSSLGHAEYALSHNTKERGVYTFCMCPGGEVVAAASEQGGVVVNGMSHRARNGKNSNSAVVCSIFKEDYGATPRAAIEFCRRIERAAFAAGGSDYSAPVITFSDFLDGKLSREPRRILPSYMNGGVRLARPESYLPEGVCAAIKNAVLDFDKKISGFACGDAVLTGAETRTSAPVRILRDNETRLAPGYENFYPAGEGAGYAGGITSAAVDGIRTAMALMSKYKPV